MEPSRPPKTGLSCAKTGSSGPRRTLMLNTRVAMGAKAALREEGARPALCAAHALRLRLLPELPLPPPPPRIQLLYLADTSLPLGGPRRVPARLYFSASTQEEARPAPRPALHWGGWRREADWQAGSRRGRERPLSPSGPPPSPPLPSATPVLGSGSSLSGQQSAFSGCRAALRWEKRQSGKAGRSEAAAGAAAAPGPAFRGRCQVCWERSLGPAGWRSPLPSSGTGRLFLASECRER